LTSFESFETGRSIVEKQVLQPAAGEISRTYKMLIMGKCKRLEERRFYIEMTKKHG